MVKVGGSFSCFLFAVGFSDDTARRSHCRKQIEQADYGVIMSGPFNLEAKVSILGARVAAQGTVDLS